MRIDVSFTSTCMFGFVYLADFDEITRSSAHVINYK